MIFNSGLENYNYLRKVEKGLRRRIRYFLPSIAKHLKDKFNFQNVSRVCHSVTGNEPLMGSSEARGGN